LNEETEMQPSDRRSFLRRLTIVLALCALATPTPADADPVIADPKLEEGPHWYSGRRGRLRLRHMATAAAMGASYLTIKLLNSNLAPEACRWCDPPGFDRSTRNALVWDDTGRANMLSNINVYVLAPAVGFGFLIAVHYDAGWAESSTTSSRWPRRSRSLKQSPR
jgi:hypothetical protein